MSPNNEEMKLDLIEILKDMPEYAIMRIPPLFPEYDVPSDIDILCGDLNSCVKHIRANIEFKLVNCLTTVTPTQFHLDYYIDGALHFKFDLYGEYISDEFKKDVLVDRRLSPIHHVYVPLEMDNIVSKCYEYLVHGKEKYKKYEQYKHLLDEYITL